MVLSVQLQKERKWDAAIVVAKRAIAAVPTSVELWSNLGAFCWNARQYDDALVALRRALLINDSYAPAHCNLGLVYQDLGRASDAQRAYLRGLECREDYVDAEWNWAMCLLLHGNYEHGLKYYEARLRRDTGNYPKNLAAPLWRGESLEGKSIYIAPEQGIGDIILFHRWLPLLSKAAAQIKLCLPALVMPLLWDIKKLGNVELLPEGLPMPMTDYSVYMGSLPYFFNSTLDTLPPDPGYIRSRVFQQLEASPIHLPVPPGKGAFKVGICWTGNPAQERNEERSIPIEVMLELASDPRVWLYSFQAPPASSDLNRLGSGRELIMDMGAECAAKGIASAATGLMECDLIITSCTMIAHLAGVLGLPCWVMLCDRPYWVWGAKGDRSHWHPNLRLFRQETPGDWKGVMAKVRVALTQLLQREE